MNKKLLWTTAGLLPLVAAPVAIVASCSTTTTSPAKAIAETLSQGENVKIQDKKGEYSVTQLEKFNQDPKTFISEIDINVTNKDQFDFEITEFGGYKNDSDSKVYAKIKIKVTDKNNNSDSAISSDISLPITIKGASEAVKAKVEEANKAFDSKTFKVKQITFDAAHLKALEGYASLSAEEKSKLDATGVLKSLFDGVVEGESKKTNLLIQKFEVTKATTFADPAQAAKPKFTITLQLAYEDVAGDKTSALTKEASFEIEYDATAKAATIIQVLEKLNNDKSFKFDSEEYPDKTITAATVLEKTNFNDLKTKFLPDDFTYTAEDFTEKDDKGKVTVSFKIKAEKASDNQTMAKAVELKYTKKTGN